MNGDQCKCCYNGGCAYEQLCRCGKSCEPDPHCGMDGDQCKCCYNGGCDFEELCRCGPAAASLEQTSATAAAGGLQLTEAAVVSNASALKKLSCEPDPHCGMDGDQCKCCYNGGCDYEELCRCGPAAASL